MNENEDGEIEFVFEQYKDVDVLPEDFEHQNLEHQILELQSFARWALPMLRQYYETYEIDEREVQKMKNKLIVRDSQEEQLLVKNNRIKRTKEIEDLWKKLVIKRKKQLEREKK